MTYRQYMEEQTHNGSIREDMSASGWLWDKALVRIRRIGMRLGSLLMGYECLEL